MTKMRKKCMAEVTPPRERFARIKKSYLAVPYGYIGHVEYEDEANSCKNEEHLFQGGIQLSLKTSRSNDSFFFFKVSLDAL